MSGILLKPFNGKFSIELSTVEKIERDVHYWTFNMFNIKGELHEVLQPDWI